MFTLALVRFPPTATKEIQYLNAKGALTYTDIAGDPVLYGNLPPREISMKDVFRSGDSSKKFKIVFFQAEDGMRYVAVTGVQTCALPILRAAAPGRARARDRGRRPTPPVRARLRAGGGDQRGVRRPLQPPPPRLLGPPAAPRRPGVLRQIGRASCRERV